MKNNIKIIKYPNLKLHNVIGKTCGNMLRTSDDVD